MSKQMCEKGPAHAVGNSLPLQMIGGDTPGPSWQVEHFPKHTKAWFTQERGYRLVQGKRRKLFPGRIPVRLFGSDRTKLLTSSMSPYEHLT